MTRKRRHSRRQRAGLTLVETALLLSLGGILLAVGVPTFVGALQTSKLSEPPAELARLYAAAAAYYQRGEEEPGHCLPKSAGPTPALPSKDPVAIQFAKVEGDVGATWNALGYEPQRPIRYRYALDVKRPGCGTTRDSQGQFALSVRAEGDLDGDGVMSLFERNASIENGELALDPLLLVRDAVE